MLAFVHIEKAAGTTLNHILRRNFFLRYIDVRPLTQERLGVLTSRDLRMYLRVNPFLGCISGHAVKPYSDLAVAAPDIRYVTLMRDPTKRYVSQFLYWNRHLQKNISFPEFLAHEPSWNFQAKKFVGAADLESAKKMLSTRFLVVGIVEEFNEFLVLLRHKLCPSDFDPWYVAKNAAVDSGEQVNEIVAQYGDQIRANNRVDMELYAFVCQDLLPRQRLEYGPNLTEHVRRFAEENAALSHRTLKPYLDYALRKVYYEPITGLLRRVHGLPGRGSY